MNKSFKLLLTSLMIGITVLTVTIIATMMFTKKGVFSTNDIKVDEKNEKFQNKSIVRPKDKTIDDVTDLKELLYMAINELNSQKYYQTKSYGRTTSVSLFKTYVQEITGNKVVNEDDVFTEALSKGSYISVARQTFVGLKKNVFLNREGRLETFSNVRWFSIERVSEENFLRKYGNTFKEFSPYIFNDQTIEKIELISSDNNTKVIRVFLKIDKNKNDNLATARYSKEIKTMSNSNSYPNFLSAFVDVKIDKDFKILKTTTEEKYLMERFGNPTCTTILHQDFTYEKVEIKDKHLYERHFLDNIEGDENQKPSQIIIKTLLGLYLEKTKFEVELFNQKFNGELDLKNFNLYLQNDNTNIQMDSTGLYFKHGNNKYKIPAEILKNNLGGGEPGGSGNEGFSLNSLISKLTEISKFIDENSKIEKVEENYILTLTIPNIGDIVLKFDNNYQLLEIKINSSKVNATLRINQNLNIQRIDFSDAVDLKDKFNLQNNFNLVDAFNKIKQMVENKYEINGKYLNQEKQLEVVITGNLDITNLYADLQLLVRYKNVTAAIDLIYENNYLYIKLPTAEGNVLKLSVSEIELLYKKINELFNKDNQNEQSNPNQELTIVDKVIQAIIKLTFNDSEFKIESKYFDLIFNFTNNSITLNKVENLDFELNKKEDITKLTWNQTNDYIDYQTLDNLIETIKNVFVKPINLDNKYQVSGNVYELVSDQIKQESYTYTGEVQVKMNNNFKLEELELSLDLLGKEKTIIDPETQEVTKIEAPRYLAALRFKNNVLYFSYQSSADNDKFFGKIPVEEIENILQLKDKIKELLKMFNVENSLINAILGIVENIPASAIATQINNTNEYIINKAVKAINKNGAYGFKAVLDINYLTGKNNLNDLELVVETKNEVIEKIELANVYAGEKTSFNFSLTNLNEKTNIIFDEVFDVYELNGDYKNYSKEPYTSPETIVGDVNDITIKYPSGVISRHYKWRDFIKEGKPVPFTFDAKPHQVPKLFINGIDSTKLLTREPKVNSSNKLVPGVYTYKFELIVRENLEIELTLNNVFDITNTSKVLSQIVNYVLGKKYNLSGNLVIDNFLITALKIQNISLQVKFDENDKFYFKASGEVAYTSAFLVGEFTTGRTLLDVYIKDNMIYVKQLYFHRNKGTGQEIHYQISVEDFKKDLKNQIFKMFNIKAETINKYLPKPGEEQNKPTPKFNFSKTLKYFYNYQVEDVNYNLLGFNPYMIPGLNTFKDIDLLIANKENNLSGISINTSISLLSVKLNLNVENIGQTDFEMNMPDFSGNWWE